MSVNIQVSLIICYVILIKVISETADPTEEKCMNKIYRECNHKTQFTTEEILTAQLVLRSVFALTNPSRPPCPISLTKPPCIRKDVKCLSDAEINRLTNAWKQLNIEGIVGNYTKLHSDYWGANHKASVAFRWHWEFARRMEAELQRIDPDICLPYWNVIQDFAYPEKSIIFEKFGGGGDPSNDYCVTTGPLANMTLTFPEPHCLRRQFLPNGTLHPWKSPEFTTMLQQMAFDIDIMVTTIATFLFQLTPQMVQTLPNVLKALVATLDLTRTPFIQRTVLNGFTSHFDPHISIGGWAGDLSVTWATNDLLFYLFHIYWEQVELAWQLSDWLYLLPITYNVGIRVENFTNYLYFPSIDTDLFSTYNKTVKEGFQYGYGDHCYLYDSTITAINDMVNRNKKFVAIYIGENFANLTCIPDVIEVPKIPLLSNLINLPTLPTLPPLPTLPTLPPLPTLPTLPSLPNQLLPPCNSGALPVAAQRLKDALPAAVFAKYFPKFASNRWTNFDHVFGAIDSDCNAPSITCRKMPIAPAFTDTPEGQRQYDAFGASVAGFTTAPIVDVGQRSYSKFMAYLNSFGYCSPYV